jgi:hypothetical protein
MPPVKGVLANGHGHQWKIIVARTGACFRWGMAVTVTFI